MLLISILVATLAAGIGSVVIAAGLLRLGFGADAHADGTRKLLSLAAGALLATAFLHLLPEALESQAGAQELFATLLGGVVAFFLLDKAELWHHGHEHHQGDSSDDSHGHGQAHAHAHAHGHGHGQASAGAQAGPHLHAHGGHRGGPSAGAWAVLAGDSVHCFGDGMLIASAFVADWRLGVLSALAVLAHEVPHHMGDLVVLRQSSRALGVATLKLSLAGAVTALGGIVGFALVAPAHDWLPYLLVLASSSFIYVALADLIPQLQQRLSARQTAVQVAWLLVGMLLVKLVSGLAHGH